MTGCGPQLSPLSSWWLAIIWLSSSAQVKAACTLPLLFAYLVFLWQLSSLLMLNWLSQCYSPSQCLHLWKSRPSSVSACHTHLVPSPSHPLPLPPTHHLPSYPGHWQEYRADRVAAMCSRKYAEGGMEFMRNRMQMDALVGYVME